MLRVVLPSVTSTQVAATPRFGQGPVATDVVAISPTDVVTVAATNVVAIASINVRVAVEIVVVIDVDIVISTPATSPTPTAAPERPHGDANAK
jgi:hypothetical protein